MQVNGVTAERQEEIARTLQQAFELSGLTLDEFERRVLQLARELVNQAEAGGQNTHCTISSSSTQSDEA